MAERTPRALILCDIDGTLMRGAGFEHRDAIIEGVRRITGLTTAFDGIDTAGRLDRDLIAALLKNSSGENDRQPYTMDTICQECCTVYSSTYRNGLTHCVLPGVQTFLERAAGSGAVLGVVSGNLRGIGLKKLERAGLLDFFSVNAFSEDGHTRAELARMAADEARDSYGTDEWSPIFLVGDHLNDVEAARTNGFYSIAVATGVVELERLKASEPTLAVADLTELNPTDLIDLYRG